jgi:tetratricopeptide (TPR) repeat protein
MNDWQDRFEWYKNTFRKYAEDITDITDWQYLESAGIYRKHTGDFDGAIKAIAKAISLAKKVPILSKETATMLNYLAALYMDCNAIGDAEIAIREAVELSRPHFPGLLADNLLGLAEIQRLKGENREALASAEEARCSYQQVDHSYGAAQAEELIEQIKTNMSLTSAPPGDASAFRESDRDESTRDP